MIFSKPCVEVIKQNDLFKHIELCGRVCYKSEDRITDKSSEKFVNAMIKSGHGSVLEHGTVYIKLKWYNIFAIIFFILNKYSISRKLFYVTTNYRVIIENNKIKYMKYTCDPTKYHEKRNTVKFIIDRALSHQFVRHRVFSFSQESQRYVDYCKGEVNFIKPIWMDKVIGEILYKGMEPMKSLDELACCIKKINKNKEKLYIEQVYLLNCLFNEWCYNEMRKLGSKPEKARTVLGNSTKTELVMTGFNKDWKKFFKLRMGNGAHPDAVFVSRKLYELIKE